MPTEEKMVDLDTSGEGAEINLEEQKDESVVDTEAPKKEEAEAPSEEPVETKQEETKEEPKKDDEQLEDYSKGVQARIAKLTRKMREAERQRDAATEYAKSVEEKRQALETRFEKTDADYIKKFETSINTGLEAAQKELAAAIEAGDAKAQVEANKRIATLAFENAKLSQSKEARETAVSKPSEVKAPEQPRTQAEPSDPNLYFTLGILHEEISLKLDSEAEKDKRVELARKAYKNAINADPNYYNAHYNLGVLAMTDVNIYIKRQNALGYSKEDLKKADELEPIIQEKLSIALPLWEMTVSLKDDELPALETLAYLYTMKKMLDEAENIQAKIEALK